MSPIYVPAVLTRPEDEWDSMIRESEDRLDEELRTDDRDYLVSALVSEVCQKYDPAMFVYKPNVLSFALSPSPHDGIAREKERSIREDVARQLLVTLGFFSTLLLRGIPNERTVHVIARSGECAFANLAQFIDREKERRLYERFSEDLFRYVDTLLCLHETVHRSRFPRTVLVPLADAGSRYARTSLFASHTRP